MPGLVRTPVYQQLNQLLRALVRSGDYVPGQRFITEREVAERFQVSRATANKAISNLVSEGVLEFRKGMGTFLCGNRLDSDLRALVSFTARAAAAGKVPETRVLDFSIVPASTVDAEVNAELGLTVSSSGALVAMQRLRLIDGQPLIFERRWMPESLVPGLTQSDVAASLYATLTDRFHYAVDGCEQVLSAINCDRDEARHLSIAVGAAGLMVRATGYLADGRPLWHERTLYRGDGYRFINRLGGVPGSTDVGLRSFLASAPVR